MRNDVIGTLDPQWGESSECRVNQRYGEKVGKEGRAQDSGHKEVVMVSAIVVGFACWLGGVVMFRFFCCGSDMGLGILTAMLLLLLWWDRWWNVAANDESTPTM